MKRVLWAALILAGCAAHVPLADLEQDSASKTFAAPSGKALIYVVREKRVDTGKMFRVVERATLFRISLDRRDQGDLSDGTYYVFTVDPGLHSVTATGRENQESIQIQANVGSVYFVSVRARIGGKDFAPVNVSLLSDDTGKAAVRASKMASREPRG